MSAGVVLVFRPLVKRIVRRFVPDSRFWRWAELVGSQAVLDAFESFDPGRGVELRMFVHVSIFLAIDDWQGRNEFKKSVWCWGVTMSAAVALEQIPAPAQSETRLRAYHRSDDELRTLWRRVFAFVVRRIGNRHDAEDVTQDVFEKVLCTFREGNITSYSLTAARHTLITRRRRDALRRREDVDEPGVTSAAPRDEYERSDLRGELRAMLATLEPCFRDVIAPLADGATYADIAAELGIPNGDRHVTDSSGAAGVASEDAEGDAMNAVWCPKTNGKPRRWPSGVVRYRGRVVWPDDGQRQDIAVPEAHCTDEHTARAYVLKVQRGIDAFV
jgi:RNA polymerase sigma factor (sigma-70 family)